MSAIRFKRTLNPDGTVNVKDTLYNHHYTITKHEWDAVRRSHYTNESTAEVLYRMLYRKEHN